MDKSKDHLELRCPRLGGAVVFEYCRTSGDNRQPCLKITDCWWEIFDIMAYLTENLTQADLAAHLDQKAQSQNKVSSLVDLINQARNRTA